MDFVQLEDHIFSDKHIKDGIMTLGKSRKDILRSGMDIINDLSSKGMLKEGPTQIKTFINGREAEIRLFMRNGKLMNFDMFSGHSPRTMGNTIIY